MPSYLPFLLIAAGTGLLIGLVFTILNNKPLIQLRRARGKLQEIILQCVPTAEVSSFGGRYVHPDVWIATVTDADRDKLMQEPNLIHQFRAALYEVGYPAEDVPLVQFVFESQETVDREFRGSWSRRRYVWLRSRF